LLRSQPKNKSFASAKAAEPIARHASPPWQPRRCRLSRPQGTRRPSRYRVSAVLGGGPTTPDDFPNCSFLEVEKRRVGRVPRFLPCLPLVIDWPPVLSPCRDIRPPRPLLDRTGSQWWSPIRTGPDWTTRGRLCGNQIPDRRHDCVQGRLGIPAFRGFAAVVSELSSSVRAGRVDGGAGQRAQGAGIPVSGPVIYPVTLASTSIFTETAERQ
jgi:hypothetical protein